MPDNRENLKQAYPIFESFVLVFPRTKRRVPIPDDDADRLIPILTRVDNSHYLGKVLDPLVYIAKHGKKDDFVKKLLECTEDGDASLASFRRQMAPFLTPEKIKKIGRIAMKLCNKMKFHSEAGLVFSKSVNPAGRLKALWRITNSYLSAAEDVGNAEAARVFTDLKNHLQGAFGPATFSQPFVPEPRLPISDIGPELPVLCPAYGPYWIGRKVRETYEEDKKSFRGRVETLRKKLIGLEDRLVGCMEDDQSSRVDDKRNIVTSLTPPSAMMVSRKEIPRILSKTSTGFAFAGQPLALGASELAELKNLWGNHERGNPTSDYVVPNEVAKRHDRIRHALRAAGADRSVIGRAEARWILDKGILFPDYTKNSNLIRRQG